jgi:DNA-directed RNA polymerase subunit RPC12/RpoP
MKQAIDINTWYEVRCPYCDTKNWLYDGDTNDLSKMDIDGMVCWNCKKKSLIVDEEDASDPDDPEFVEGRIMTEKVVDRH